MYWNLSQWADDLFEFCQVLGIERPIVLGHSFGGMVAQAYCERYPDHPAKLVLAGTYAKQDIERCVRRFEELAGPAVASVARQFWTTPTEETMAAYNQQALPYYSVKPIDEESVNLITYQQQFQSAARFIAVTDELTSVLLNLV